MSDTSSHILTVEEDKDTGDLYITFPPGILESLGWTSNDTLEWTPMPDDKWQLTKVTKPLKTPIL